MRTVLILLAAASLLLCGRGEAATSCSASMSGVTFGDVNPFGGNVDVTATLNYSCTSTGLLGLGLLGAKVKLCFSIADGLQGSGHVDPRRMTNGANAMSFNLYKDASRSLIWGTRSDAYDSQNRDLQVPVTLGSGSASGSITVYARVPGGQAALIPGSYANSFAGTETELVYRYNEGLLGLTNYPSSCTSGGTAGSSSFGFAASASVSATCNPSFAVQDIDFGTHGLLTASIDTTATVSPQCTNTTPYQVGLDNGLYAVGNTRRMRSSGGRHVGYELYRNAGRSQRWGNTPNTDTVAGTGTGSPQSLPIYARVAPQTTPPEGTYSDTVTVTIYY